MATWGANGLTNKGRNLQNKAQAGIELKYTKIVIGDGNLGNQSIGPLNGVISPKMTVPISRLRATGEYAAIGMTFDNSKTTTGFTWREIGLYAQDPDVGEIMYWYANAGTTGSYIPPGGTADYVEQSYDLDVYVGTATNITATINESLVFATQRELDDAVIESKRYTDEQIANVRVPDATLLQKGITQLSDATNSTSNAMAATPNAVKKVWDYADAGYRHRGNVPLNWNTAVSTGDYAVTLANWTGYSNYPPGAYSFGKLVVHGDYGARAQIYYTHDNPTRVYTRVSYNDTDWRPWTEEITSNTAANWQKYKLTTDDGTNKLISNIDLNNLLKNGEYVGENLANCPFGTALGTWAYVEVMALDAGGGYVIQKLYDLHNDYTFYVRTKRNGTWGPWSQDLFTSVVNGKGAVAGAINGKGGNVSGSNTFAELAAAITNLPVKRFASGTFNGQSAVAPNFSSGATMTLSVTSMGFSPSRVFIRTRLEDNSSVLYLDGFAVAFTSGNIEMSGRFNNRVSIYGLTAQTGGFKVTVDTTRINDYAGGAPIATVKAYEWFAYE